MTALATAAHLAATDSEFQALLATDPDSALRSLRLALTHDEQKLLQELSAALRSSSDQLADHLEKWLLTGIGCPWL